MIVKCIAVSISSTNSSIINSDMREYLKIDINYEVYGLRISEDTNYYMIFDGGHLFEIPSQLFEIVDSRVCPLWVVRCATKNKRTFWPELFYKDDFFENFSEWEEVERKAFDRLRQIIAAYKEIFC